MSRDLKRVTSLIRSTRGVVQIISTIVFAAGESDPLMIKESGYQKFV